MYYNNAVVMCVVLIIFEGIILINVCNNSMQCVNESY
jgi:hypothetical protein